MSDNKSNKKTNENADETRQHQNRGARGLEEDAVKRQREEEENFDEETAQYQGEYHGGEGPVRGDTQAGSGSAPDGLSKTDRAHQGKGGLAQNNLGQQSDRDDDMQSGSKGGNRSGKTGTRQGGHRGQGTK